MRSRAKILLLIRQLIIGGAESQTYELAKGLDRNKYQVSVCSLQSGGYFAEKMQAEGIPVSVVAKRWCYDFTVVPRLVSLFRRERPDIVHCVMWTANMWGGLAARLAQVPRLVLSTRSIGIWKRKIHYIAGPLIFNRADLVLANSVEVGNYMMEQEGVRPDKIQVIYNGLDLGRYCKRPGREEAASIRIAFGLPPKGPVIGIVANLSPQKDYWTFLRAAARAAKHNNEVSFLIVGDGTLRASLKAEAARLGLARRVVFAGQRPDVERCLACMDAFVLCSLREGFSNALIEAMASGLPVVATRVGGNIEAVRESESGFLFEVGDDKALAYYILRLINNREESRVLGEHGRQRAMREFSMTEYLRRMDMIYTELLGHASL